MDWFNKYEEELRIVFHESRRLISGFPEPLNDRGTAYLDHFNVFAAGSHKNYICYLLPYWMQSGYGLRSEDCRKMAVGNIMFMLYFFIQDDVMDTGNGSGEARWKLPLANMLYLEFLRVYQELFPADSPLWPHLGRYVAQWAGSVAGEAESDYFMEDRVRIAHKASPLKVSSTGALLLAGAAGEIARNEELLDIVLITLQLLDDLEDWEEDLAEGCGNSLLSMARRHYGRSGISAGEVKDYIYTHGGLVDYAGIAAANHAAVTAIGTQASDLLHFHDMLGRNLQHIASAIEAERQLLMGGGLQHWLSKHIGESQK